VKVPGGFGRACARSRKASKGPNTPRTLLELAASVGIKASDPYAAEIRAILGGDRTFIPGYGNIVRTNGTGESFDRFRKMAAEGGLLGEGDRADIMARTRPAEALERMRRERNFGRQEGMTEADQIENAEAREAERVAEDNARYDEAREDLRAFLKEYGYQIEAFHPDVQSRAIELIMEGVEADEAMSIAEPEVLSQSEYAPKVAEIIELPGWDDGTLDQVQEGRRGVEEGSGQRPQTGQGEGGSAAPDRTGTAGEGRGAQGEVGYELGAPGAENDLQGIVPGAEKRTQEQVREQKKLEADQAKAEEARVRAQQSMIRKQGQRRVEDDEGGLFGERRRICSTPRRGHRQPPLPPPVSPRATASRQTSPEKAPIPSSSPA
jgi:hypothetical protein